MGLVTLSGLIYSGMGFAFHTINKKRDAVSTMREDLSASDMAELGDKHPDFRYTY